MVKIEHSVVINCPVDEVFAFVARPENTPRWQSGMVASQQMGDGPMEVGTVFSEVRRMMGREMDQTMQVTAFEPNRRWSFKSIEAAVAHEAHLTFEDVGGATRINLTSIAHPAGLLRLAAPLIGRQLKQEFVADFANLKQLLEDRPAGGFGAEDP